MYLFNKKFGWYSMIYLQSRAWFDRSNRCKKEAGQKCKICGASRSDSNVTLNTHHLTYSSVSPLKPYGQEKDDELICVCQDCHKRVFHP